MMSGKEMFKREDVQDKLGTLGTSAALLKYAVKKDDESFEIFCEIIEDRKIIEAVLEMFRDFKDKIINHDEKIVEALKWIFFKRKDLDFTRLYMIKSVIEKNEELDNFCQTLKLNKKLDNNLFKTVDTNSNTNIKTANKSPKI